MVTLRELRLSDAPSLLAMLATDEVARFISPPPTTVDGFERFIAWTHRERAAGNYICFGVVPHGMDTRDRDLPGPAAGAGFRDGRMGLCHRVRVLGHGRFIDGAKMVVDFAFDVIGAHRLEARAAVANGRGNGALRKVGALQEGILRKSFLRNGAVSRPDPLDDSRRGLAPIQDGLGFAGSLDAQGPARPDASELLALQELRRVLCALGWRSRAPRRAINARGCGARYAGGGRRVHLRHFFVRSRAPPPG